MTRVRVTDLIVAVAVGLLSGACTAAATPSPLPSPPIARAASPAASGSVEPPPTPAPTLAPGILGWQMLPTPDALRSARFVSVSRLGNRFLGVGCVTGNEGCVQPAIWESPDGFEWQAADPVFLPPGSSGGTVVSVASSELGTVAAGNVTEGDRTQAAIWLRGSDGWAQVTPQAAGDSTIHALLATDRRAFAIGSGAFSEAGGFHAWWSPDATTWQAATAPPDELGGYPTGMLPAGDRLLAWGPSCGGVCVATTAWWVTADGTAWRAMKPPRGLEGASIGAITTTGGRLEAFGSLGEEDAQPRPAAWVGDASATEWQQVLPLPDSAAATIIQSLPIGDGAVVAGDGGGPTGVAGYVWLRGPGEEDWRAPMLVTLPDGDVDFVALLQHPQQPDRIIVIGRSFVGVRERLHIWTGRVNWTP